MEKSGFKLSPVLESALATDADEEDFKNTVLHLPPKEMAEAISTYKGIHASERMKDALVVSGDQVAATDCGQVFNKAKSLDDAREQLIQLNGKTLYFYSATTICQGGEVLWQGLEVASATHGEHPISEIDAYLADMGSDAVGLPGATPLEDARVKRLIVDVSGSEYAFKGVAVEGVKHCLEGRGLSCLFSD